MSVRFSEVTLTAVIPEQEPEKVSILMCGHPATKKDILSNPIVHEFCQNHLQAVSVHAGVQPYLYGFPADEHDADMEHLQMIEAFDEIADECCLENAFTDGAEHLPCMEFVLFLKNGGNHEN